MRRTFGDLEHNETSTCMCVCVGWRERGKNESETTRGVGLIARQGPIYQGLVDRCARVLKARKIII